MVLIIAAIRHLSDSALQNIPLTDKKQQENQAKQLLCYSIASQGRTYQGALATSWR